MTTKTEKLVRLVMFSICAYFILQYSEDNILMAITLLTILFITIDTYFPNVDFA